MTAAPMLEAPFAFTLPPENEAGEPAEARGLRRDDVRLLVSRGTEAPRDATFADLGAYLSPGDVVVVNTSATINAAFDGLLPDGSPVVVHYSGSLPGGLVLVEVRTPAEGASLPYALGGPTTVRLCGATVQMLSPFADSRRLWVARFSSDESLLEYSANHGHPIRYRHARGDWPLSAYQTVFAREPGSAEMPSAARPFSSELVTDLVTRGVAVVPLLLHTGVSSLEGGERPYPEYYRVSEAAASALNAARGRDGRIIAVGTTVVRALATVSDERGRVHAGEGLTEVVVTPENPVRGISGLLTGWHEPASTHLLLLESFLPAEVLEDAYAHAIAGGYHWHEFGDSHLLLPEGGR